MSELLEFHISCPQCNYSNTATSSIAKYKEVVYQPCNDNEGQQDHNMKDQMRCDNCHNSFEFYWCAGHNLVENNAGSGCKMTSHQINKRFLFEDINYV